MPEPLGRDPLLLDYDVLSSGRPEDMKWSEWAAMRSHTRQGIQALLAEVERLRAIATPLERLEAWRLSNLAAWAMGSDICSPTGKIAVATLHDERGNVVVAGEKETLPAAITAALDAWDAKYGKDTP